METAEPFLTFIAEIAKLLLTFVADIIHYIAWPAAVITIVVLLHHPIKAMFARIKQARVKKGDTELTIDLTEKALEAFIEEKPGPVSLANVTPDNLDWNVFVNVAGRFQLALIMLMMYVPLDRIGNRSDFIRVVMSDIERVSSALKDHMSAADLDSKQKVLRKIRNRFAHILDAPS